MSIVYCSMLVKIRQPSDFIELLFNGNQAWLMVQEEWPCVSVCTSDRKEERKDRV